MKSSCAVALGAVLLAACSTGQGTGSVTSTRLFVSECWDGPFDLGPTFFASDPSGDTQIIRVQRGDEPVSVSDGVLLIVNDVSTIRSSQLGKPIPLGLPIGVNPPGFPPRVATNPPQVSLTLYLYNTCHNQDGAVYSVSGEITFDKLFSGNRNEDSANDRLTDAHFTAKVVDPREANVVPDGGGVSVEYPPNKASTIDGNFRFFFQRGQPAQPFP